MDNPPVLFSTAYLPPVKYFSELVNASGFFIEKHENFIKQTYRNRCRILGTNGPIDLVVPIEKGRSNYIPIRDTKIYNSLKWQQNHWRTIFSAYNSSPFFEYYKDEIKPFYEKEWKFLLDFNTSLLQLLLELLDLPDAIKFSDSYQKESTGIKDLRNIISPKNKPALEEKPYTQVFSEKFGFVPNLSIIDLLFNMGPESII